MKVKITQPGWELYTGPLYACQFINSVSQEHLSRAQALQLGAMVTVVEIDDDGNELGVVSPTQEMVKNQSVSAEVVVPMKPDTQVPDTQATLGSEAIPAEETIEGATGETIGDLDKVPVEAVVYTENQLLDIAQEKGISGLREIGEPLGVKNTAIRGLIREILAAQNGS